MNRKVAISIGIVALLGAYIVLSKIDRTSQVPDLKRWESGADEIVISKADRTISFVNIEGVWLMNRERFPADKKAVEEIEKMARSLDIIDLVSRRGFYSRYDLTPEKSTVVTVRKGGSLLRRITIGKQGSTSRHTFIRVDDDPGIYLASGNFTSLLDRDASEFRDREICRIDHKLITGLAIKYRGRLYAFSRMTPEKNLEKTDKGNTIKEGKGMPEKPGSVDKNSEARWTCKGFESAAIDTGKVESRLSLFNPLNASDYPAIQKVSLPLPVCIVTLKADGREIVLNIIKKGSEDRYIATSSESPYIFTVEGWKAKRFFVDGISDFKAEKRDKK